MINSSLYGSCRQMVKFIQINSMLQNARSGLIVFLVAIPLCLGIALASGAPLMSGLIAGIIGGIVVGSISNSKVSASGPAAGLSVVVFQGILDAGSFQNLGYAIVLAGLFQIALGIMKSGRVTDYLPLSVIEGMMASIGLLLIIKQVPYVFGESSYQAVYETITLNEQHLIHSGAILLGGLSILLYMSYRYFKLEQHKIFRLIPFPLVLVVSTSFIALNLRSTSLSLLDSDYVHIKDFVNNYNLFQNFNWQGLSLLLQPVTIKLALIIAIVASIESLLSIEAADKLDPKKSITNKNLELFAQGTGNIISGLLGGLPITSVVVRTSVNVQSGANSKASTIIHGFYILIAILFMTHLIDLIPLATLATILIFTGYNLVNPKLVKKMYNHGVSQFIPFLITIASVLALDLLKGVVVGLISSILFTLKDHYYVQNQQLKLLRNDKSSIEIKFGSHLTFLIKKEIRAQLNAIPNNSVCSLNFERTIHIDHEIKEIFEEYLNEAQQRNIQIITINDKDFLKGVKNE